MGFGFDFGEAAGIRRRLRFGGASSCVVATAIASTRAGSGTIGFSARGGFEMTGAGSTSLGGTFEMLTASTVQNNTARPRVVQY